jgi:hypothetical protein
MRFLDLLVRSLGGRPPRSAPTPAIAATPVPSTTFAVSEVTPDTHPLPEMAYRAAVESQLAPPPSPISPAERRLVFGDEAAECRIEPVDSRPVEACARYRGRLLAGVYTHPFVSAAHIAFTHHRPLTISPDMIWLMIMQGFAAHVNNNAETLRSRFVKHKGQALITIQRDDFIKGSPENPWEEVFAEFSGKVREHIGSETHDILLPRFSTTGEVERAAAEVVLLEAMQRYFDFALTTLCGIPSITLEGVAEDWVQLILRTRALAQFGLEWWVNVLVPILEEFGRAARGEVRTSFWRSLYKENDDSGGPYLTGWVTAFFPYLVNLGDVDLGDEDPGDDLVILGGGLPTRLNRFLTGPDWGHWNDAASRPLPRGTGLTFNQVPSGLSRVPFRWKYLWRSYRMEFLAGFVGVHQDTETLALRPEIGWAVREASRNSAVVP